MLTQCLATFHKETRVREKTKGILDSLPFQNVYTGKSLEQEKIHNCTIVQESPYFALGFLLPVMFLLPGFCMDVTPALPDGGAVLAWKFK